MTNKMVINYEFDNVQYESKFVIKDNSISFDVVSNSDELKEIITNNIKKKLKINVVNTIIRIKQNIIGNNHTYNYAYFGQIDKDTTL